MQGYDYMLYEKHLSIYVANSLVNIRSYSSTYMTYFLGWQIISETYAIGDGMFFIQQYDIKKSDIIFVLTLWTCFVT